MSVNDDARIPVAIEHVEQDQVLHTGLAYLVQERNLLGEIVPEILALVPDVSRWRLTLTGDSPATVNTLEARAEGEGYTTSRGAGHVGGVSLPRDDGSFDIVLGAWLLVDPPGDYDDLDGLVEAAIKTGRHLARHEAGHVLLRLRDEDGDSYRDHPQLTPSAAAWTHTVAAYMDDFRIERHTRMHTPPEFSHLEGLGDAITHLSRELTAAKSSWREDLDAAAHRSDVAIGGFMRVIAYLGSELGLEQNGNPVAPRVEPEKWDRYLGTIWPLWSSAFHKLRPVDEPMSEIELAGILGELCELACNRSSAIGYERGVTDDARTYAFWTQESY